MLRLTIPKTELWNETTSTFEYTEEVVVDLEHSLVSLSKWESFYEKPFLNNLEMTDKETRFYIECMCLTPDVDTDTFRYLSSDNLNAVNQYIKKKHTATWFSDSATETKNTSNKSAITSEIIYYCMTTLNIPFETQYWNLNRLLTLIKVINLKNQPAEKLSKEEAAARAKEINARYRMNAANKGRS